jgi:glyoxylate carboligase
MVLFRQRDSRNIRGGSLAEICSRRKPQPMTDELMTVVQAATLKQLAQDAYELDAFKPNLTRPEADKRIAMLTAKLKLLDGPPHTL